MRAQDTHPCSRHPHLPCPGECQYQLGQDECIYETEPAEGFKQFCGKVVGLLQRPLRGNEVNRARNAYSLRLPPESLVNLIRRGAPR